MTLRAALFTPEKKARLRVGRKKENVPKNPKTLEAKHKVTVEDQNIEKKK